MTQYKGAEIATATTAVKTSLKKINWHPFKLYYVYLDPFNLSNEGDF